MEQVQVSKMAEHTIVLENQNTEIDPIPVGSGQGGKHEPEMAKLSDILDQFNDIHWQNIETVKQQIDSLPDKLLTDENFMNAAKNSNKGTAQEQAFASTMSIVVQMMNENTEFCRQYLDNNKLRNVINERVFHEVYNKVQNGLI